MNRHLKSNNTYRDIVISENQQVIIDGVDEYIKSISNHVIMELN